MKIKKVYFLKFIMSEAEYSSLCELSQGACLSCGKINESQIEPDARQYPCDYCKKPAVYGAEELILKDRILFTAGV